MDHDLKTLLHEAAPEPTAPLDASAVVARAARQRRARRAGVLLIGLIITGLVLTAVPRLFSWPQRVDLADSEPGRSVAPAPAGWRDVGVGGLVISIPGDWPIMDLDDTPAGDLPAHCHADKPLRSGLWVTSRRLPAGRCPLYPDVSEQAPRAWAYLDGAAAVRDSGGEPVSINGVPGRRLPAGTDETRVYLFENHGLRLELYPGADAHLVDLVLSTVRPSPTPERRDCRQTSAPPPQAVPDGWQPLAPPPFPHSEAVAAWTGGELLVAGGDPKLGGPGATDVMAYDPAADRWTCLRPLPESIGHVAALTAGEAVYAWGSRQAFTYEPAADE